MRFAAPPRRASGAPVRPRLPSKALPALALAGASWMVVACGETVLQIDPADVVELLISTDSARIGVGRTFDLDVLTLDQDHGLLVIAGAVGWSSSNAGVVTVDENGMLSGESVGTASVVASF